MTTEKLQKAQSTRLDLTSVLSPDLYKIITANADAIGLYLSLSFTHC